MIGNRVADSRNDPCPSGYYREANSQPAYGQPQRAYGDDHQDRGYRGEIEGPIAAMAHSVPERIDWLRERISHAADEGSLSRYQARAAYRELGSIREAPVA